MGTETKSKIKIASGICAVIILGLLLGVMSNRVQANNLRNDTSKIETITVQRNIEFKLSTITKAYSIDGVPFIKASFIGSDNIGLVKCEIPIKYEESLVKDTIYDGKVIITYIKSLYELGKTNSRLDIINNEHRILSNLRFMFSDYVVDSDSIKDTNDNESIKKLKIDYIGYTELLETESIANQMNTVLTIYIIAIGVIIITNEIIGIKRNR